MSSSQAIWSLEDMEAPLPYIRRNPDFKPDDVKFEYEYEKTTTKTIQKKKLTEKNILEVVETYTEATMDKRPRKVKLHCYGHTAQEDAACLF